MESDWAAAKKLLEDWNSRARLSQHSHHEAGKFCKLANYWLALPVIVITTVLGGAAFVSIEQVVSNTWKIWFGVASVAAAVLSALQTHLQFLERSERHKNLGAHYGNIRREIEQVLAFPPETASERQRVLNHVRERFDAISAEGPVVSRGIFEKTVSRLNRDGPSEKRVVAKGSPVGKGS